MNRTALFVSTMGVIGALGCGDTSQSRSDESKPDGSASEADGLSMARASCLVNADCPTGFACYHAAGYACGTGYDGVCVARLSATCNGDRCPCLDTLTVYPCTNGQCIGGDERGHVDGGEDDYVQCWVCRLPV
jgi:hypothetical protein